MNTVAQKSPKPQPAAGQVWIFDGDTATGALPCGPLAIVTIDAIEALFKSGTCAGLDWMRSLPAWRCVGVETPAGRVMVGERRQNPGNLGGVYVVALVYKETMVEMHGEGFASSITGHASAFASWPLGTAAVVVGSSTRGVVCDLLSAARPALHAMGTLEADGALAKDTHWLAAMLKGAAVVLPHGLEMPVFANPRECPHCGVKGCAAWENAKAVDGRVNGTALARAHHEQRRREIDSVLQEDARRFPAFATARRCAVMSNCERSTSSNYASTARSICAWIREYEDKRGGMTKPSEAALRYAAQTFGWDMADVYERARSLP